MRTLRRSCRHPHTGHERHRAGQPDQERAIAARADLSLTAHLVQDADVLREPASAPSTTSANRSTQILRSKVGVFIEVFRKARELAALNARLREEVVSAERAAGALDANRDLERRVEVEPPPSRAPAGSRGRGAVADGDGGRAHRRLGRRSGVGKMTVHRPGARCSAARPLGRSCALRVLFTRTTRRPRRARCRGAGQRLQADRAVRPDGASSDYGTGT